MKAFTLEELHQTGYRAWELKIGQNINNVGRIAAKEQIWEPISTQVEAAWRYPQNDHGAWCDADDLADLRREGYGALEIKTVLRHVPWSQYRMAGFDAKELRKAGCSIGDLKTAGFNTTLNDLCGAGYAIAELKTAGFNATLNELRDAGLNPALNELRDAGFSAKELKLNKADFSSTDLKNAGFDATELREAGYSLTDLKIAGFDARALLGADWSPAELKAASFDAKELYDAGCMILDLKKAGFDLAALKWAGLSISQLRCQFTAEQLLSFEPVENGSHICLKDWQIRIRDGIRPVDITLQQGEQLVRSTLPSGPCANTTTARRSKKAANSVCQQLTD